MPVPVKPKNLVLSGGGAKGKAYGAALSLLEETKVLAGIEHVIGSSVGGLTASLLALGFNLSQINEFLDKGSDGLMDLYSSSPLFTSTQVFQALGNLLTNQGAAKGYTLFHSAQASVAEALGHANATFADLAERKGSQSVNGGTFRNLSLTVTVDDERGAYQIVCSPQSTPNMPIALAMRMTAGLPPVFPSVKITPEEFRAYTEGATEPLVQYERGVGFPAFRAKTFHSESEEERQAVIEAINEDIFTHPYKDGLIYCSDGGIVDNLPIYLATNKPEPDGLLENTLGCMFEEPWRRTNRLGNRAMYQKDKIITANEEKAFIEKALNIPKNDRAYHLFQNRIMKSKIPPSQLLGLLQQDNLLCFETDDIQAADFDLADETSLGKVIKSKMQKIAYLNESGYKAGSTYLKAKGMTEFSSFEAMYPEEEPAPSSIQDQLNADDVLTQSWDSVVKSIVKAAGGSFHDEAQMTAIILEIRSLIKMGKALNSQREEVNELLAESLLSMRHFTESHLIQILEAKKECDRLFAEINNQLGKIDTLHLKMVYGAQDKINELRKKDPKLADTFDTMIRLKESSKLFNSMLSLVRDPSLKGQRKPKAKSLTPLHEQNKEASAEPKSESTAKPLESVELQEAEKSKKPSKNL